MSISVEPLPERWYPLRPIGPQLLYVNSPHRFNVVPAGRRSGKTERAKRKLVRRALSLEGITHNHTPRFFAGAPVRDQAKRIFWEDLKDLSKPWWADEPSEGELCIRLITGAQIWVVGLDKPERVEGQPWDGGLLDEYANMKAKAWGANVRPALSDRNGWCDLIGVPEGRNHYYELAMKAKELMNQHGAASEWGYFHWTSAEVLPEREVQAAREDLDPLTFQQEYEGSFVTFAGRAYYGFTDDNKLPNLRSRYDPSQPLRICLDFNVAPGVAAIVQELPFPSGVVGTAVIGEVYIENNSNTPAVCRKILADWQPVHKGRVEVYGDATGGSKGTAKVLGSDWDLVRAWLTKGGDGLAGFGDRVSILVKPTNPSERARVNAMNTRCRNGAGLIRLMVDPAAAPRMVKDFEGVVTLKGGSGELDKDHNPTLTHITDALGYYVDYCFPVAEPGRWGTASFAVGG